MLKENLENIFWEENSINLKPFVYAEWNQNIFNSPYVTTSGDTTKMTLALNSTNLSISSVTDEGKHPNFDTNLVNSSINGSSTGSYIKYSISCNFSRAYKVVFFAKGDEVTLSAYANDGATGSTSTSLIGTGWSKIELYVGTTNVGIGSFTLNLVSNKDLEYKSFYTNNQYNVSHSFYFTTPEVYSISYFDYLYHSLYPTDSAFTIFRPGESYVESGSYERSIENLYHSVLPPSTNEFRKVNTPQFSADYPKYMPISPITMNPSHIMARQDRFFHKQVLPSSTLQYKYFISGYLDLEDFSNPNPQISAIYEKNIYLNKLVFKFNTTESNPPTINISLNGESPISVNSSTSIQPDSNGILILYWNGLSWTKNKWQNIDFPKFDQYGNLSKYTTLSSITITQVSNSASSSNLDRNEDLKRIQVIEISPRLIINLNDFVENLSINKSIDSDNSMVPISPINSNDCSITFSNIPINKANLIYPVFSSQSNLTTSLLSKILGKNIKFYVGFDLLKDTEVLPEIDSHIPGGIFYSDTYEENDADTFTIQCFDITRYLQKAPVNDYVTTNKTPFDIITNILDLSGFTDYDYDSLYQACSSKTGMDIAYYFVNSRDTTILDALSKIFTAYQIGCYIDEFGIMKFLSLRDALSIPIDSLYEINESNIIKDGYSISHGEKPGKISIRYQSPKIKQSPSVQNATNAEYQRSSSFIYTTSNATVWSQQSIDAIGFNYLKSNMLDNQTFYKINLPNKYDIFSSYLLDSSGYAIIEEEIVSFSHKDFTIGSGQAFNKNFSAKNQIEMESAINSIVKYYQYGLSLNDGTTKGNTFNEDWAIGPTGYITNVKRGLFGTPVKNHSIITNLLSKDLGQLKCNSSYTLSGYTVATVNQLPDSSYSGSSPSVIGLRQAPTNEKGLVYPMLTTDPGYKTYSIQFQFDEPTSGWKNYYETWPTRPLENTKSGLFFNMPSTSSTQNTYFLELCRSVNTSFEENYELTLYYINSGIENVVAKKDVTGVIRQIFDYYLPYKYVENGSSYNKIKNKIIHLKLTHYPSLGSEYGEDAGEAVQVFINNIEIFSWQIPGNTTNPPNDLDTGYKTIGINTQTKLYKKLILPTSLGSNTYFGAFSQSNNPVDEIGIYLLEIYACEKALKESHVNYHFQDKEFLNCIIEGYGVKKLQTYMMQTTPVARGLNYYDVEYTNPATTSSNVYPIEYLMQYVPTDNPKDSQYIEELIVEANGLSYSTVLNSGFKAKMAIVNNSPYLVFLNNDSNSTNLVSVFLALYTHELVAPSDPETIDIILNKLNIGETVQLDSEWIQSKDAALKIIKNIEQGIDKFSRTITLQIFGNPLFQIGDKITLSYPILGINQQKHIVRAVSHSFGNGLNTTLTLNPINDGISYTDTLKLTTIKILPSISLLAEGETQQFSAYGYDQYNNLLDPQPTFSWSTNSGTISSNGLYDGSLSTQKYIEVKAQSGLVSGSTEFVANANLSSAYIVVDPNTVTLNINTTQIFSATLYDGNNNIVSPQPTFIWNVESGGGTIDSSGLYTAPSTPGETTISVSFNNIVDYANISIIQPSALSVTLNGNGNTSGPSTKTLNYNIGDYVILQNAYFGKTGHTFAKWNTMPDGSGIDYNVLPAIGNLLEPMEIPDLYAIWVETETLPYEISTYDYEDIILQEQQQGVGTDLQIKFDKFIPYDWEVWEVGGNPIPEWSTEQSYSSTHSLKVVWNSQQVYPQMYSPMISSLTGITNLPSIEKMVISAWVYVPTGSPDIYLNIDDGQYGAIAPWNTPPYIPPYAFTSVKDQWVELILTVNWTEFQYITQSPEGIGSINIEPDWEALSTGSVYIDDISIKIYGSDFI